MDTTVENRHSKMSVILNIALFLTFHRHSSHYFLFLSLDRTLANTQPPTLNCNTRPLVLKYNRNPVVWYLCNNTVENDTENLSDIQKLYLFFFLHTSCNVQKVFLIVCLRVWIAGRRKQATRSCYDLLLTQQPINKWTNNSVTVILGTSVLLGSITLVCAFKCPWLSWGETTVPKQINISSTAFRNTTITQLRHNTPFQFESAREHFLLLSIFLYSPPETSLTPLWVHDNCLGRRREHTLHYQPHLCMAVKGRADATWK